MTEPPISNHRSLQFREDIEGLRGVAVLLVLAYHFGLPPITGGYIGVDIFFVISGYLITSVLAKETGIWMPLKNFYRRRIMRLLPTFVVFALVTTIVCALILLPEDLVDYLRSLRSALSFQSNYWFDAQAKDYFGASARELPLLHTWSLSIEWQFYLYFPLLYLAAQAKFGKQHIKVILFAATMALTALSIVITRDSNNAYFLTSARFFELLVGACLTHIDPRHGQRIGRFLVLPSVAALCYLAVLFTPATTFPGLNAVLVCLLTAVVILYGTGNRWMSAKWIVGIGRVSYSAYLWHWPLIAFFHYLHVAISPLVGGLSLIFVLLLANASYNLVEQRFRRSRVGLGVAVGVWFVAPLVAVGIALWIVRNHDGFPQRLGAESVRVYEAIRPTLRNNQRHCHDFVGRDVEQCAFGDPKATSRALLIGDSHARHYWWFVDVLAKQATIKANGLTYRECPVLPGADLTHLGNGAAACSDATTRVFEMIRRGGFKYVLIGEQWTRYSVHQLEFLHRAVAEIITSGATPIILMQVAEDGASKRACFYSHIKLRRAYRADECAIDQANTFAQDKKAFIADLFARIRVKYPSVIFVDPQMVQCQDNRCATDIDGVPIYDDAHHINGYGSTALAHRYLARFGNPLRQGGQ